MDATETVLISKMAKEYLKGNLGYFSPTAVIYQLNLRGQSPRHLTFSKKIGQMPHHVGSLRGQTPHRVGLHRASNAPPPRQGGIKGTS